MDICHNLEQHEKSAVKTCFLKIHRLSKTTRRLSRNTLEMVVHAFIYLFQIIISFNSLIFIVICISFVCCKALCNWWIIGIFVDQKVVSLSLTCCGNRAGGTWSSTYWRNSTLSLHNTGSHLSPSHLSELHLILPFNQFITWKMCELNRCSFSCKTQPQMNNSPAPSLLSVWVSHAHRHVLWLLQWQPFHYSQEHNCFITREGVGWRMALKLPPQWLQFNGKFFTQLLIYIFAQFSSHFLQCFLFFCLAFNIVKHHTVQLLYAP